MLSDGEIIVLYFDRDERAITETDRKYGRYLLSAAKNFLCDKADIDECVDDAYLGVWNAIPPVKPKCFKAFLVTILRRSAIKRVYSSKRKSIVPSELLLSFEELEIADIDENIHASFDPTDGQVCCIVQYGNADGTDDCVSFLTWASRKTCVLYTLLREAGRRTDIR